MLDDRIAKLSDLKKQCLRLAHTGLSSKEIAPIVGRSHRTVDQYLYEACLTLKAENRREAARILAEIETAADFSTFQLKSPDIENPSDSGIFGEPSKRQGAEPRLLDLPPIGGPPNDLTPVKRLIEVAKIALFLMIVVLTIIILVKGAFIVLS